MFSPLRLFSRIFVPRIVETRRRGQRARSPGREPASQAGGHGQIEHTVTVAYSRAGTSGACIPANVYVAVGEITDRESISLSVRIRLSTAARAACAKSELQGLGRIAIGYREFDRPVPRNLRRRSTGVPDRHVFRLNNPPSPSPGYASGHILDSVNRAGSSSADNGTRYLLESLLLDAELAGYRNFKLDSRQDFS